MLSTIGSSKITDICKNLLLYQDLLPKNSFIAKLVRNYVPEESLGNFKISGNLTSQEIQLLNFLVEKINQIVSRDEIAASLWGKDWNEKYSDWAIDKLTSKIRSKIVPNPNLKLITVRNLGYKLIKI